jgi:cysteinyl-tRNA synthetase
MTRRKDIFEPLVPGKVSMYSCGLTAYDRIHLGECRRFVFSDLLSRYLEYRGYSVTHVMNITDLDDKTIRGSEKAGMALSDFTRKYIEEFKEDLNILGIKPAETYPKASEHTDDMVSLTAKLVKNGFAYEKLRSIYFDISRFKTYGKLSGVDINKIKLGATVDLDDYEKDNPRDFTLLKRAKLSELRRGIYVQTDWGNVRPSWHLQCAAMSMKYLGESYDIHTASRELVFPHHENEIAIAGAVTGKPLAKYWIHCDRVLVDGKKVDEKGTTVSIQGLLDKGYTGREIRYWLLSSHYRKLIQFAEMKLENAGRSLKRLDACVSMLLALRGGHPYGELKQLLYDIKQGFINAMDDDLNISAALASIFGNVKKINKLVAEKQIDAEDALKIIDAFKGIDRVLNLFDFETRDQDAEIDRLISQREAARANRDWDAADEIRDILMTRGVQVRDRKV